MNQQISKIEIDTTEIYIQSLNWHKKLLSILEFQNKKIENLEKKIQFCLKL